MDLSRTHTCTCSSHPIEKLQLPLAIRFIARTNSIREDLRRLRSSVLCTSTADTCTKLRISLAGRKASRSNVSSRSLSTHADITQTLVGSLSSFTLFLRPLERITTDCFDRHPLTRCGKLTKERNDTRSTVGRYR